MTWGLELRPSPEDIGDRSKGFGDQGPLQGDTVMLLGNSFLVLSMLYPNIT